MRTQLVSRWQRVLPVLLSLLLGGGAASLYAQTPALEEIQTVSTVVTPVQSAPFVVATAGQHDITLQDLGAQLSQPAPLAAIQLAVMRGPVVVTTLTAAGTKRVDLSAGTYTLRAAGQPGPNAGSGLFSVAVQAVGAGSALASFTDTLSAVDAPVPDSVRVFESSVSLSAGSYTAELVDLAFPQGLVLSSVIITAGASPVARLSRPATPADQAAFNSAATATYSIFALGDAGSAVGGLFVIRIRDAANAVVYSQALGVGRVVKLASTPSLAAGSYTLFSADLAFPAALTQSGALLLRASQEAVRSTSPGSVAFTVPAAGVHEAFALAVPGTNPGSGALAIEVRSSSATSYSAVSTANGAPATATPLFSYPVDIAGAGNHVATLTDMQFPASLSSVNFALVQSGAVVARANTTGDLSVALVAGRAHLLVAARPPATSGSLQQSAGMFGARLTAGSNQLFQTTQGVGATFSSRSFTIASAGDYRFTFDDVGFPAPFLESAAVVTRGMERLGLIFGEGSFDVLQAPAGSYQIGFITRPDATLKAGTFYLSAQVKPPVPTISLTSNPASPVNGVAFDINWTAQNAASCTASGAWSGSKAITGTEHLAGITTSATFTLACIGAGGNATTSLTVTPSAPGGGGGGGAVDRLLLAGMLLLVLWQWSRRGRLMPLRNAS
jgi:hypothetical protein